MAKKHKGGKYNIRDQKLLKLEDDLEKLSMGLEEFFEQTKEKLKEAQKPFAKNASQ